MTTEQENYFNHLYNTYAKRLMNYALALTSTPDLAQEAMQDTFLEVVLHIDYLMEQPQPERWLQQTLKHKCRYIQRSYTNQLKRAISLDDCGDQQAADPQPEALMSGITVHIIHNTIAQVLTPEEQRILQMFAFDHMSYRAIAEATGLTIWNCQKRIQRIRKKLRPYFPNF